VNLILIGDICCCRQRHPDVPLAALARQHRQQPRHQPRRQAGNPSSLISTILFTAVSVHAWVRER
jgi:hypothetical protein